MGRNMPSREPIIPARSRKYPVYSPEITKSDFRKVLNTLEGGWVSLQAPVVSDFEARFKEYVGTRDAVVVNSGTAALECSLLALGIGAGDEVIIPDFSFIQIGNTVLRIGATPILVDSEIGNPNMDLDAAESKISRKTKAIVAVHTYGIPLDYKRLKKFRKDYKIFVIEDCAEAMGIRYPNDKMLGSLGDVGCFSLYANKLITAGEGGIITTNSKQCARLLREYRNHGYTKGYHFWHYVIGGNYKPSAMQVALAYSQLCRIEKTVKKKYSVTKWYVKHLKAIKGIDSPFFGTFSNLFCWMFPIILERKFPVTRDNLRSYLADRGVETRSFFYPLHMQPCFKSLGANERFPNSHKFANAGLYLPSSPMLKEKDVETICSLIKKASTGSSQERG